MRKRSYLFSVLIAGMMMGTGLTITAKDQPPLEQSSSGNDDPKPEKKQLVGRISTSSARVFSEGQAIRFIGHQLDMVERLGERPDLKTLYGTRARASSTTVSVKGAAKLSFEPVIGSTKTSTGTTHSYQTVKTAGGTTVESSNTVTVTSKELPEGAVPSLPAGSINITPLAGGTIKPVISVSSQEFKVDLDPIDQLMRIDDYYAVYENIRLSHIRDTSSRDEGWGLYMLAFDASVRPGSITRRNYQAVARYEITEVQVGNTPFKGEQVSEFVKVLSVYPRRYTLRYREDMSAYLRLDAAGKVEVPIQPGTTGWPLQAEMGLNQQSRDKLEHIQNYPIVSGFIDGPASFGWVFSPRPRIVSSPISRTVYFSSELFDDDYPCTAIVMFKEGNYRVPRWVYGLSEKNLLKLFALKNNGESEPETINNLSAIKNLEPDKAMLDLLMKQYLDAKNKNTDKSGELSVRYDALKAQYDAVVKKGLQPDNDGMKLALQWLNLHKCYLRQNGALPRTVKFTIQFLPEWRYHHLECPRCFAGVWKGDQCDFTSFLPGKVDRTLIGFNPIWPSSISAGRDNWVTALGQGLSNDAVVLVGTEEADSVEVLTDDHIRFKVPKTLEPSAGGGLEDADVKIYVGGEAQSKPGALKVLGPAPTISLLDQEAAAGDNIRIESNQAIMDRVESVRIGGVDLTRKSNQFKPMDGNKVLFITVPKSLKSKTSHLLTIYFDKEIGGIGQGYVLKEKLVIK